MATDFYAQHSGKYNNNSSSDNNNSRGGGRGRGRGGRNNNNHHQYGGPQQQQGAAAGGGYTAQASPPMAPGAPGQGVAPVYFQAAAGVVGSQQPLAGLTIAGGGQQQFQQQQSAPIGGVTTIAGLPGLTIANSGAGPSLQQPQPPLGVDAPNNGGGRSGGVNVLQMINSQTTPSGSTPPREYGTPAASLSFANTPSGGGSPLPQGGSSSTTLIPAPRSSGGSANLGPSVGSVGFMGDSPAASSTTTSTTAGSPSAGAAGAGTVTTTNDKIRNDILSELGNVVRTADGKWAVGQFVYVPVTKDGKKEIATITAINGNGSVTIYSERSGYEISVKESVLKRAFLIILDLNGVLVHRKKSKSQGLKRPHVDEFLDFLLTNFVVGVWSSCIPSNGKKIVDHLLSTSEQRKLKFQMWRDDCTPNPTPESPYATKKDLLKVWARYPSSFNETNTVIIDDSADKCSHPKNAFVPSSFEGDAEAVENDVELLRVKKILQEVIDKDDLEPMRREGGSSPQPADSASAQAGGSVPPSGSALGLQLGGAGGAGPSTPPSEKSQNQKNKKSSPTPPAPPTPPRAVVEEDDEEEVLLVAPSAL